MITRAFIPFMLTAQRSGFRVVDSGLDYSERWQKMTLISRSVSNLMQGENRFTSDECPSTESVMVPSKCSTVSISLWTLKGHENRSYEELF